MTITYLKGDATKPNRQGIEIIAHIVNNINKFGSGFVVSLFKWPEVKHSYHQWHALGKEFNYVPCVSYGVEAEGVDFQLGNVQFIKVEEGLYIANMIAQEGVGMKNGPPIRYEALEACLEKVAILARKLQANIVMPRIGTERAGGSWDKIEPIIQRALHDLQVSVYDLV